MSLDGLTVENVTIQNGFLRGIQCVRSLDVNLNSNTIENFRGLADNSYGIVLFVATGLVADNQVNNAMIGMGTQRSRGVEIRSNQITASDAGIVLSNSGANAFDENENSPDRVIDNIVSGCTNNSGESIGLMSFVPKIPAEFEGNQVEQCEIGLAV